MPKGKPKNPIEQKVRMVNSIIDRYHHGEHWKWCKGMIEKHLPELAEMLAQSSNPSEHYQLLSDDFHLIRGYIATFMAAYVQWVEKTKHLSL